MFWQAVLRVGDNDGLRWEPALGHFRDTAVSSSEERYHAVQEAWGEVHHTELGHLLVNADQLRLF